MTHLNFYHNSIQRVEGIHQLYWPNLMRLTLRDNDLKSLRVRVCMLGQTVHRGLRWHPI